MEPAASIIIRLGGEKAVSKITGLALTAPYRWQYPVEKGGTGGLIPQKHHVALLDYARAHGIELTPAAFFPRHDGFSRSFGTEHAGDRAPAPGQHRPDAGSPASGPFIPEALAEAVS